MKTHAGHLLHALDPSLAMSGPGRGYGVMRATESAVSHIEMAGQVQAPPRR